MFVDSRTHGRDRTEASSMISQDITIEAGQRYLCSDGTTTLVTDFGAHGHISCVEVESGLVWAVSERAFRQDHGILGSLPEDPRIAKLRALCEGDIPQGLQDGEHGWDSLALNVLAILDAPAESP